MYKLSKNNLDKGCIELVAIYRQLICDNFSMIKTYLKST